ncbi:hypothetical protein IAR55_004880 [Kwoniella newhampshirensis]|uniref:RNase III domain-containing protein n=1 Tax=Kwoniella newhampshirensis TaxID=1651941 RepID=A0AAW0YWU8_9TREE
MALASSSSSVLRSTRCLSSPLLVARPTRARRTAASSVRGYAATATATATVPLETPPTPPTPSSTTYQTPPSANRSTFRPSRPSNSETTGSSAQSYLTNLLSLPPHRQFPPSLALQILTHKSYRYSHPIRHLPSSSASSSSSSSTTTTSGVVTESSIGSELYNSRLSFLGRRAFSTYLSIFVHDAFLGTNRLAVEGTDFLRGKGLQERLDGLRHTNNLGRVLGSEWGLGEVIRWDRNETSREGGDLKIKGMTIEAILGGIYTQFGSPAAHRTFHQLILPHFSSQLRDPRLVERVQSMREELEKEFGPGILPRS